METGRVGLAVDNPALICDRNLYLVEGIYIRGWGRLVKRGDFRRGLETDFSPIKRRENERSVLPNLEVGTSLGALSAEKALARVKI